MNGAPQLLGLCKKLSVALALLMGLSLLNAAHAVVIRCSANVGARPVPIGFCGRMTRRSLCRALEAFHGEEQSVQKNGEIEKAAAVLDIVQIVLERLVDGELAVAAKLP
jgi:hypothetical protein